MFLVRRKKTHPIVELKKPLSPFPFRLQICHSIYLRKRRKKRNSCSLIVVAVPKSSKLRNPRRSTWLFTYMYLSCLNATIRHVIRIMCRYATLFLEQRSRNLNGMESRRCHHCQSIPYHPANPRQGLKDKTYLRSALGLIRSLRIAQCMQSLVAKIGQGTRAKPNPVRCVLSTIRNCEKRSDGH
ncbi:hypothetical protein F5Y18DRAFT_355900 [Xylariaceae sp. FL1019]|nr:hypothetical protein F5Y18DRAFT_355900 [Xylariaceae sp. FL1019]